jgi:gamma-glutamylcyclotransferase (GGCT)/AIG2-like uncharacterized protein YtfP
MPTPEPPWLFAYGTLGPRGRLGRDAAGWRPDAVRGRLYDLGPYPALVDLDDPAADWVEGHVRPADRAELERRLDPYEGVGEGLYRRVAATTREGRRAWVYTYARPLPASARGPIRRWGGPPPVRP